MKNWRSGVPRPESVVATSVGVCSSAGASGVPSWKGSESRLATQHEFLSVRYAGLQSGQ
jgi:hypothetical protein